MQKGRRSAKKLTVFTPRTPDRITLDFANKNGSTALTRESIAVRLKAQRALHTFTGSLTSAHRAALSLAWAYYSVTRRGLRQGLWQAGNPPSSKNQAGLASAGASRSSAECCAYFYDVSIICYTHTRQLAAFHFSLRFGSLGAVGRSSWPARAPSGTWSQSRSRDIRAAKAACGKGRPKKPRGPCKEPVHAARAHHSVQGRPGASAPRVIAFWELAKRLEAACSASFGQETHRFH